MTEKDSRKSKYTPTIGLEIHVQLKTKSKMFCQCENNSWKIGVEEFEPNSAICPVCTGQPGTLPVANEEAIKMVVKTGLALGCKIAEKSKFDRKNYFYPDLPKGYQISQYDQPICEKGKLNGVGITRIHLEEDTGRIIHNAREGYSLVDFNRAGVPLMELVTEPEIHSAKQAKTFCQELQKILRAIGISDADMEKSQMRCEVNVSITKARKHKNTKAQKHKNKESREQEEAELPLGTKVEIKNLNSFKAVERAIEYEVIRQGKILDEGKKIVHETRGWNEKEQKTVEQRSKEEAHDYRYFPEPDLPPVYFSEVPAPAKTRSSGLKSNQGQVITNNQDTRYKKNPNSKFKNLIIDVEKIRAGLGELPQAKVERFMEQYGFQKSDAEILVGNNEMADFTENVMSELRRWLASLDEIELSDDEAWEEYKKKLSKLTANWLINKLGGLLSAQKISIDRAKITSENFAEFITLVYKNKVNSSLAMELLPKMLDTGGDPSNILEDEGLHLLEDVGDLEPVIDKVIKDNPGQVKELKAGKTVLIKFFIGAVMKESKGKANPKMAEEMLMQKLTL